MADTYTGRLTIRAAAQARVPLSGPDAQALEGALQQADDECATLKARVVEVERHSLELQALFDLQQRRMGLATQEWQEATGNPGVLPDLGRLIEWLREGNVALRREGERRTLLLRLDDWHEDYGPVLWWILPISEKPYVGSPMDSDWPGYHTHWTELPCPSKQQRAEADCG